MTYSRDFERESDYVGAYYAARAGYDLSASERVWRNVAQENPAQLAYGGSHPTSPERFLLIQKTAAEIADKKRRNAPLSPEAKPATNAATAEIARTQLWQWLHSDGLHLDDGTPVDFALLERALLNLPARLGDRTRLPGASRINEAIGVLDRLTHADVLEDFLTLPAYARLD